MSSVVSDLVKNVPIPRFVSVKQNFCRPKIPAEEIPVRILTLLEQPEFAEKIQPGMRVCITAGSRGIDHIVLILHTLVSFCKKRGAFPFLIPAMGSHGGATAEGQREVLTSLGITEESVGCPIYSSMETVLIGQSEEGHSVCVDRFAAQADAIILCCRIKPHTCFRGEFESGIMKMMTIGLGKQAGAEICHASGFQHMARLIPMFGRVIRDHLPIAFALATLENPFDETCQLEALLPEEFESREPKLLQEARQLMPRIWLDECDVLVVDQIGKNISGDGMDPNITGTFCTPYASGGLRSQRVCILGLTEQTHGNGNGIGMAHAISQRLWKQLDLEASYPNAITATVLHCVRVPMIMANDRETIQVCIRVCNGIDHNKVRIIRIQDSLHIGTIMVSESLIPEVKKNENLEILTSPFELPFDKEGNLF